jgi:hypothetical protein
MKLLILAIISFVSTAHSMANNDFKLLIKKVDHQMEQLQMIIKANRVPAKNVTIPWDFVDAREASLLNAMVNAYGYLKTNENKARYHFMYEGMKAASLGHPNRVPALEKWLSKGNQNIYRLGLPHRFYDQWKKHVAAIHSSIEDLNMERPTIASNNNASSEFQNQYKFLSEIKNDLSLTAATHLVKDTMVSKTTAPERGYTNFEYFIFLLGCLSSLMIGIAFAKRRRVETKIVTKIVEIKTYKDIAEDKVEITIPAPSLEEECRRLIDNNLHLLEVADLKVYPVTRSPFKTTVNAPQERVYEALDWLLKGTIAIANANGKKISHMEWNCMEQSGRVSLEFVLHGLECDFKSLYLNTLVDGNYSAPAYFGRSEMALTGHYPTVAFKSGNKRTTVSLGLDSLSSQINH